MHYVVLKLNIKSSAHPNGWGSGTGGHIFSFVSFNPAVSRAGFHQIHGSECKDVKEII